VLKEIRDLETLTLRGNRVKEYKLQQDKRLSPAINVGICILVSVDTVRKNAMGVVLQIIRLQIAPRRRGIGKVTHKFQAWEITQSRREAPPTNATSGSNNG